MESIESTCKSSKTMKFTDLIYFLAVKINLPIFMSLLANLLAFSSIVNLNLFRIPHRKEKKDPIPPAPNFLEMIPIPIRNSRIRPGQLPKVWLRWTCSRVAVEPRLTQSIDAFTELVIAWAWRWESITILSSLPWKRWKRRTFGSPKSAQKIYKK